MFLRKIEAKPAALLVQSRTQQKSFLFLLPARRSLGAGGEEKIGRAQNEKSKEYFSVVWRVVASDGGAKRQFRSKKVRAKCRIRAQANEWIHSRGDLNGRRYIELSTIRYRAGVEEIFMRRHKNYP